MARWAEIEEAAAELAERARALLDAHVHKTIATVRADGSPRISGIEANFALGDLWFTSMTPAVKARDLLRDPRFALHSMSEDPPGWSGDAKLSGRAVEATDPEELAAYNRARGNEGSTGGFHLFRAEIADLVVVRLNDDRDRLVIEHWNEERGLSVSERE